MLPSSKPYHPAKNHRLAPELYTVAGQVYFMTICAYLGQKPFVRGDLNRLIIDTLREEQERQHCVVYAYCLMPDHLHFLVSPVEHGISVLQFTDQFKGKATNRSWSVGWRGKLWQPRYYDHIVRTDESVQAIAEYIIHNPVRRELVEQPDEWPWSGMLTPMW